MIITESSELFKVVSIKDALDRLLKLMPPKRPAAEELGLESAMGRFLAKDVASPEAVPPFDRSTMDGFAVRAGDTFGASEGSPAYLRVSGRVFMGKAAGITVKANEAAHIPTGGMLPAGADAVLMVEYTAIVDEDTVEIVKAVGPGDNVVKAGEDIKKGELLLGAGRRLKPHDLGALAAVGLSTANVCKQLRVGILSTGDEIVDVGEKPGPGQVRDVNYFALAGLVRKSGAEPVRLGICPDDAERLKKTLEDALQRCHLVLISGGSSVGVADLTPAVINSLGEPGVLVHGISIKPGKPTIVALLGDVPVFGLPGHPLGALDVYRQLVDPVVRYMYGGSGDVQKTPWLRARLGRSLSSVAGREDRVRVVLAWKDGELWAHPVLGKSGMISLMTRADGVAVIPFEAEGAEKGEEVDVEPL